MAVFAVAWDAVSYGRLDTAEATTNWTAEGISSLTNEGDFRYQGSYCIAGLVKTSEVGFYCAPGSTDLSTTSRTWIAKFIQTNKDALDGIGIRIRIGSDSSNYYYYSIYTATTYPPAGGFQVVCIDPNVSQWRTTGAGSPALGSANYFAIRSDCSATAKSQNLGMDAVDVMNIGTGLTGTDGISGTAGTFADFLSTDEGTTTNRWGVIQSRDGIYYVNGVLTAGNSGTGVNFEDANAVVVFPDHYVTNGFCGMDFDIQNASTTITLDNCVFNGVGDLYTSDDTRPDYTVTGTSGDCDLTGCTFNGYRQIDLTSGCLWLSCNFLNGLKINANSAVDLSGSTVEDCTGAADASALEWDLNVDPNTYLDGMSFTKGSTATHAITFGDTIPSEITLTDMAFSGYNASDDQNDSTLYFADTTGTITVNLVNCTGTITEKNAGCTVDFVINPVTLTVTTRALADNSLVDTRVLVETSDSTGPLPYEKDCSITRSVSTATLVCTAHGIADGKKALVRGANEVEYNGVHTMTWSDANTLTYTVSGTPDTPATDSRVKNAQDETSYDNSPTTEGAFSGGSGHAATDVLTLSNNLKITVDTVSSGEVTEFTVDAGGSRSGITAGDVLTQISSTGSGVDFTLTPDTDNLGISLSGVIIDADTTSGVATDTRSYSGDQPIKGTARKMTASPYYRTGAITGTVGSSSGLSTTVQLVSDE